MTRSLLTCLSDHKALRFATVPLAIATGLLASTPSYAGHHFETKLAQEHPEYDLTDVYVFRAQQPGKTVFIVDANPTTKKGRAGFGKDGLYNFHFGFDRGLKSGHTFTFKFDGSKVHMGETSSGNPKLGTQGRTICSGRVGQAIECPNGIRLWTGAIHEPFFGNGVGLGAFKKAVGKGKFTPEAFNIGDKVNVLFKGKYVSSIVVEVPSQRIGVGKTIHYYATTAWQDRGHWHQVNRIGHVLLPHLYLQTPEHNKAENEGRPVTDKMRKKWVKATIRKFTKVASGQRNATAHARKAVDIIMPDVVPYVIGTEAHYGIARLNGRKLSDDAMDTAVYLLCGRFVEDYVHPTGNYQLSFPYVKPANR